MEGYKLTRVAEIVEEKGSVKAPSWENLLANHKARYVHRRGE